MHIDKYLRMNKHLRLNLHQLLPGLPPRPKLENRLHKSGDRKARRGNRGNCLVTVSRPTQSPLDFCQSDASLVLSAVDISDSIGPPLSQLRQRRAYPLPKALTTEQTRMSCLHLHSFQCTYSLSHGRSSVAFCLRLSCIESFSELNWSRRKVRARSCGEEFLRSITQSGSS